MFRPISSLCRSITSKKATDGAGAGPSDGVLLKIQRDVSFLKDPRLWRIFRMSGYVILCVGTGVGGIMAALGLLAIIFAVLVPFWIAGGDFANLTSLICWLTGMPKILWVILCQLIAISPGIVILRIILPLWWRLVSLRIAKLQAADGGDACIS